MSKWYQIFYKCPECSAEWQDYHSCACNDECPNCEARHIEPINYQELENHENENI